MFCGNYCFALITTTSCVLPLRDRRRTGLEEGLEEGIGFPRELVHEIRASQRGRRVLQRLVDVFGLAGLDRVAAAL